MNYLVLLLFLTLIKKILKEVQRNQDINFNISVLTRKEAQKHASACSQIEIMPSATSKQQQATLTHGFHLKLPETLLGHPPPPHTHTKNPFLGEFCKQRYSRMQKGEERERGKKGTKDTVSCCLETTASAIAQWLLTEIAALIIITGASGHPLKVSFTTGYQSEGEGKETLQHLRRDACCTELAPSKQNPCPASES